jgi:glucose-6-phosphate isomerase
MPGGSVLDIDISLGRARVPDSVLSEAVSHGLDELRSLLGREGAGADMLGWLDLPLAPRSEIAAITECAKRIQDENDCLVVAGIGGSYLGARAAIEALPDRAGFPVLFAGINLSPEHLGHVLETLEGKRFAVCVVSKSGTTLEPAIAFRILRQKLLERFGARGAQRRIVAITDREAGALRALVSKESWTSFPIPRDVGGRFSVLSAVGLFPCAAAGIPIDDIIEGAAVALESFTKDHEMNAAVRYAALRHVLHGSGAAIEVLSTFHPELSSLCEWWKQLAGESEGKRGSGLFPASAVMTTDLHSLGQYLQEGSRSLLETFLAAAATRADIVVPRGADDLDGLDYLAGRRLGQVNRTAFEGTREAHAAGGIPVLTLTMDAISPRSLGELFVCFEIAISVSARLLGVNPFDQPGVEEYKRRMFKLLGRPEEA